MQRNAAIIDLDDTIIAFDSVSSSSWQSAVEDYAARDRSCNAQELIATIQKVNQWYWSDPVRHREGRNNLAETRRVTMRLVSEELDWLSGEAADAIADEYTRLRTERLYLFPGAHEMLTELRARGIRLALVSNGEGHVQREKLTRFDLSKYFDHFFIEGELGYGKPDERVYHEAMTALASTPAQTAIFGDNIEWEVRVPQQLGLFTLWHDWRRRGLPAECDVRPDVIITSLADVPDAICS